MRAAFLTVSLVFALSGRGAITGVVAGSDGRAVAGARVSAFALETSEEQRARWVAAEPARKPLATATTDPNGAFSLDAKGVVDLRVEAAGRAGVGVRAVGGDDVGVIEVPVEPLARATVTANGKPLAGATVIVVANGAETIVTTDANGQAAVPDPKRIASHILVRAVGYAPAEREIDAVTTRSADVAMNAGVALTGRVVASDGKTPVANAAIQVDALVLGTTNADGTFTIEHAPPASRRIAARSGDQIAARLIAKDKQFVLRLGPAATIRGSLRDTTSGAPIAGAQVTAGAPRYGAADPGGWTISDDKGNFTIAGLAGGAYELTAQHPNYATPRLLVQAPARKTLYAAPLARVSGSVVDDTAHGIAGVAVTARRLGGDIVWSPSTVRTTPRVLTAPNGRFLLRIADEGSVRLDAAKSGLPAAHSGIVRVAPGVRATGVVITIPRGVALAGRVIARDEKPIAGAAVAATEAGNAGGDAVEPVRTNADGTFSLRVREGTYDVGVTAPGFAPRTVRAEAAANAQKLEIVLEAGVEITGRLTRGGVPVAGADIFVISGGDVPPVQTNGDGRFRIADLAAGPVTLALKKPSEFLQATRSVTAPANVDVDVPAGGRIAGRVVDKATHAPVTAFDAGLTRGGAALMRTPVMRAFTSDDGSFAIEGVPAGTHTLTVTAPGYALARVPNLSIDAGKSIDDVDVELERGVRVTGHVTGPDNAPAGGVLVRIDPTTRDAASNDPFTLTDPDGGYVLESVEPGATTLAFSRSGLLTVRKSVTLSGPSAEVDAQLGAASAINGIVVSDGGALVANADVRASSASDPAGNTAQTDDAGTFAIPGVAAGHYEITATRAGFGSATLRDVEIPSSSAVRLVIRRGGTITGRITGLTPPELQSTTVQAWAPDAGTVSAVPDDDGRYRIDGAPSGTVRVSASVQARTGSARSSDTKSIQLDPGGSATADFDFAGEITVGGRITRSGAPLAGVDVSFAPASAAQRYARTTADPSGRYEITGIDPGRYTVTVYDVERGSYATPYDVRGSATFDIDLRGVRVTGRVTDASSGAPIAEARVELRRAGGADVRSTLSDASGAFAFEQIAPGTFDARAQKTTYGSATLPVTVSDTGAPPLEIKLTPSAGVLLRVTDARDGRPLDAWYHAEAATGESYDGVLPATADAPRIALAAGTYRITVGAAGYAPRAIAISAPGEQTVTLTPGGTIVVASSRDTFAFVRILDGGGRPLRLGPGAATGLVRVDPAPGQTRVANIPAGTYTLQLVVNEAVLQSTVVTVAEGATVTARL